MSWMDSWSRPGKHAAVPPPLYLTSTEEVPYCQTCGRVMSSRKSHQKSGQPVKYCSDRCRNRKPGPMDRKIEKAIVALLNGEEGSGIEKTAASGKLVKGDKRIIVTCDEIEEIVFGSRFDPTKVFGRRKNRASRVIGKGKGDEWKSVDMESHSGEEDDAEDSEDEEYEGEGGIALESADGGITKSAGPRVRPPQTQSEINFSAGGGERGLAERIEESPADLEKRLQGQRRANEREMVRRAARRAVVFGCPVEGAPTQQVQQTPERKGKGTRNTSSKQADQTETTDNTRRKCEALMNGQLVEPSFAKGDWAIRWRE